MEGGQPTRAGASKPRGIRTDPVLWVIVGTVAVAYSVLGVTRYLQLATQSWDLGIFTEYVKQFAHLHAPIVDIRGPGFNLLGDHFHPIVAVLAPFFRLAPTPVTLLIAQALLTALSVIPVYRAADQLLSRGAAQAITAAYGLSWGLQQLANYDFHEIAFAVPLLAASLSALIRGRTRAALWWALPLVLVKEDQGFTLAALGLIIAFSYRRRAPGLILAGWGLAWSLLAILVIIPHFNQGHSYGYWLDGGTLQHGLHLSAGAVLHQFVTAAPTKLTTIVAGPARHRIPRALVTAGAGDRAGPGAAVRVHQLPVLGHAVALQRAADADRVHCRDRRDGSSSRCPRSRQAGPAAAGSGGRGT